MEKVYNFLNKITGEKFNKAQWDYIIDNVDWLSLYIFDDADQEKCDFVRLLFVETAIKEMDRVGSQINDSIWNYWVPDYIDDKLDADNSVFQKIWEHYQNKYIEFCKLTDD